MSPSPAVIPIARKIGATIEKTPGVSLDSLPKDEIATLYRATGAVFFRGFEAGLEDFEKLTSSMTQGLFTNKGAAFSFGPFKRSTVGDNPTVLTATGNRQDFPLPVHGEFYYFKFPPRLIWFYCANPAPDGGETTIADGASIMDAFSPETAAMLRSRRINYIRHLADGDWQVAFQTTERAVVEEACRQNDARVSWRDDGSLTTEYLCHAVVPHENGSTVFINDLLPVVLGEMAIRQGMLKELGDKPTFLLRWEDGEELSGPVLDEIVKVCYSQETPVPAKAGDILMIDNTRILHGRKKSSGLNRKVLVRMGSPSF